MINKRLINTGVEAAPAVFDPLQNFETVTYTGNGSTQKITGYIRKGAAFNGSSSKIDTSLTLDTNTVNGGSISLWFKTSQTTPVQILLGSQSARGGASYGTSILLGSATSSSDQESFTIWDYDGGTTSMFYTEGGSTFYQDGEWHHLVITSTSTTKNIYIDGVPQTVSYSSSGSASANLKFTDIQIGANLGYTDTRYFDGLIDQVRIFDKAISSSEVTTLYNETYDSSTKSTTDIFSDGSGVALYELDDDANDTGTTPYGTGAIDSGQSAVFNGSSSYINTGISSLSTFSVSMWINDSVLGSGGFFGNWNGTSNDDIFMRTHTDGTLRISFDGFATQYFGTAGDVTVNTWHHVVVTHNSGSINVYLDGSNIGSTTTPNTTFSSGANFYIGDDNSATYFNGKIDQVRIYSSALSASDVEALASETNVPTANLVAHYKLDGDATDETGSYNGTPTSITYSDPAEFPLVQYNGTPTNINFLGMAFQPDLVWLKSRSATWEHFLQDSVRGAANYLRSNSTGAEGTTSPNIVSSFDANGFTVLGNGNSNNNNDTYVAWCWKAADTTTTIAANTVGNTIASDVRANTDAGFSIVKFTSPSSGVATIGTGLNQQAELVIGKVTNTTADWPVFVDGFDTTDYLLLNTTTAKVNHSSDLWNLSNWSSSLIGCHRDMFGTSNSVIAYCFHSVDGYQKVGSYTGTGLAGNTVTTGFEPRFVMIKSSSNAEPWFILDAARDATNPRDNRLMADSSAAEDDGSVHTVDFTSTGFTANGTVGNGTNGSEVTYIYLAIA